MDNVVVVIVVDVCVGFFGFVRFVWFLVCLGEIFGGWINGGVLLFFVCVKVEDSFFKNICL